MSLLPFNTFHAIRSTLPADPPSLPHAIGLASIFPWFSMARNWTACDGHDPIQIIQMGPL